MKYYEMIMGIRFNSYKNKKKSQKDPIQFKVSNCFNQTHRFDVGAPAASKLARRFVRSQGSTCSSSVQIAWQLYVSTCFLTSSKLPCFVAGVFLQGNMSVNANCRRNFVGANVTEWNAASWAASGGSLRCVRIMFKQLVGGTSLEMEINYIILILIRSCRT